MRFTARFLRFPKKADLPPVPGLVGPMFHGTHGTFAKFRLPESVRQYGDYFVDDSEFYHGLGIHFGTARQAADRAKGMGGANIRPVYLDVRHPLRLPDMGDWDPLLVADNLLRQRVIGWPQYEAIDRLWDKPEGIDYDACYKLLRKWIEKAGYDAIVYRNRFEGTEAEAKDSYIIWHPRQIRPAFEALGRK